jgi:signal transduction histidine kinase
MNQQLQTILDQIQQNKNLSAEEKDVLVKALKKVENDLAISEFKLERTEKVKRTTAILLEETIAELELKRKAVEEQNHELEIESALERVRSVAMGMKKREDMLDVCKTIAQQLALLKVNEIRNVQTAIFYDEKGVYTNYEYYAKHDKLIITDTEFRNHPVAEKFANQMMKGPNEVFIHGFTGQEVKDWLEYQKGTNVFIDNYLETASSLTYYWYSLGPVALGMSTYVPLKDVEIELFKRFRNVFELAYRRYLDIEKAAAQAREAQIQLALERVRARTMAMQKSDELSETVYILFQQFSELGENPDQATIGVINEKENVIEYWVTMYGNQMNKVFKFSIDEPHVTNKIYNAWNEGKKSLVIDLSGKDLLEFMTYRAGKGGAAVNLNEKRRIFNVAFFSKGLLIVQSNEERSEESIKLLERFAAVFEQTYTRFLDLKKAEAQAREAQIEAALERVRSRTMAMHKSSELLETADLLFDQLKQLGAELQGVAFAICDKDSKMVQKWTSIGVFFHPYNIEPGEERMYEAWKNQAGMYEEVYEGERQKKYYETFMQIPSFREGLQKFIDSGYPLPTWQKNHAVTFKHGYLLFITLKPFDETQIFLRFGKVFEQTYTRFLDLQKAEAQARESQIQLALERVRARTMAMQKSEELQEVVHTLLERLKDLNVEFYTAIIILFAEDSKDIVWWLENKEKQQYSKIIVPYANISYLRDLFDARENGSNHFSKTYSFEVKNELFHHLFSNTDFRYVPEKQRKFLLESKEATMSVAVEKNTGIHLTRYTDKTFSDEDNAILKRFVNVFEQTYTRFLDLQKAEAQARESQIEAALERVRSRSMGMQKSEELKEVIQLVYEQFIHLNIFIEHTGFLIDYKTRDDMHLWIADQHLVPSEVTIPWFDSTPNNSIKEAKEKGQDFFTYHLDFEEKNKFYRDLFKFVPGVPEETLNYYLNCPGLAGSGVLLENIGLYIENFSGTPYSEEDNAVLMRFGKVFQQTYTRFLDLQKAEAQAREAQIEAALERVRSRSLAMHSTKELGDVVKVIVEKLKDLGVVLDSNGVILCTYFKDSKNVLQWIVSPDFTFTGSYLLPYFDHPIFNDAWESKERGDDYFSKAYTVEEKNSFFDYAFEYSEYKNFPDDFKQWVYQNDKHILSFAWQKNSSILIPSHTGVVPTPDEIEILKRFTRVFEQAYIRFLDLQKAEAQAREAKIAAALEKVRSRTLAMQKSDELAETSAVLFQQLIQLGIEPNRLYISIIQNDAGDSEFWITDEDGSKVSSAYTTNLNSNYSFRKMYDGWKEQRKSLIIDMHGKELEDYFHLLNSLNVPFKGGLSQTRRVQHIAYFGKGFIGMASPEEQPGETMQLLERFAAVFNLTFTRFNDLKVAEAHALQAEQDLIEIKAARKKAEDAFTELQATQKQLIQSEKMASLGELTAGIAHEIQNPLNFVNNFSDVSNELLDEMKTELAKGNTEDALAIAEDVRQNLEKILYHGKRADGIVKGMLQHSRTSSGQKELTDINALTDEYLRLAYHGLRAKDKSFNAKFETGFDNSLEKINIVPQEIGRVILNLINNAFYAVSEKQKLNIPGYEPTVVVKTTKNPSRGGRGGEILISVKDNGNGIPDSIKEKIFQPFFTTKPTGQGTGLGLSLSYDIVKAHGGAIKVESKVNEGTEFIIVLPGEQ